MAKNWIAKIEVGVDATGEGYISFVRYTNGAEIMRADRVGRHVYPIKSAHRAGRTNEVMGRLRQMVRDNERGAWASNHSFITTTGIHMLDASWYLRRDN